MRLSALALVVLVATPAALVALATPAAAVDLDCRQSPQLFCYADGRFCILYLNESWAYVCINGTPITNAQRGAVLLA